MENSINTITMYDATRNYKLHQEEFDSIINKILLEGKYINGPEVQELEKKLCQFTNSKYCIGLSSGTDALLLALMALDIKENDEIITTSFTWISTSEVISLLKAKPVFVDIDPLTFNIDTDKIEEKITKNTKAILPVSIFGKMCDLCNIMKIAKKYNLYVIEDAAQSLGSKFNNIKSCSMADISCTSFYPTKSLGCFGDGGACFTNDEKLYYKIKALKDHGCLQRNNHTLIGINGRLDTIQAGILLVKLKYFKSDLENRIKNANLYNEAFKNCKNITIPYKHKDDYHIYSQYTIKLKKSELRNDFINNLKKNKINVSVFYPNPLHLQKCFSYLKNEKLLITEKISNLVVSLPVYPDLIENEIRKIINLILEWDKNVY